MAHEDSQNRGPLKVSSRPLRPGKRPKKSSSNPLRKSRKVLPWWDSGPLPHERWPGVSFDFKPVFSTLRDRWAPLGGQYQDTLAVAEMAAAVKGEGRRWVTYYRSLLQNWAERDAVSKFTCPQMAFRGRQDEFVARGHGSDRTADGRAPRRARADGLDRAERRRDPRDPRISRSDTASRLRSHCASEPKVFMQPAMAIRPRLESTNVDPLGALR